MDDLKWRSLNQLLEDISALNSESEDSIHLLAQLVLELASERISINGTSLQTPLEETYLTNRDEELV